MDRALDFALIEGALGSHPRGDSRHAERASRRAATAPRWQPPLPTAEQLQSLLAEAEIDLFLNRHRIPPALLRAAWYLHGVASASRAHAEYGPERQRRAFQVSAHIFDLASAGIEMENESERLSQIFAAQVGYHRSDGLPNAQAIARRRFSGLSSDRTFIDEMPTVSLHAGIGFLGLDMAHLRQNLDRWRSEFGQLSSEIGADDLTGTPFGAAASVVEAIWLLLRFLTRGSRDDVATAQALLNRAVTTEAASGDQNSRWVAAHLRLIADEIDAGSLWTILPPETPPEAVQAFTISPPAVLNLWPPQRDLLTDGSGGQGSKPIGLDPSVRRLVVSVPTSGGKTLFGEILMVVHLALQQTGVCYVTPLRSLGREVRRNLRRRLRVLATEVRPEMPDYGLPEDGPFGAMFEAFRSLPPSASNPGVENVVDVMTPERLSHALRENAEDVLTRYGLFVFDEVHLLGEQRRGPLVEYLLSFLHWRTKASQHRIVLLSAALGNAGHIRDWLDVDGQARKMQSKWRGPRRLHAIFNTEILWADGPFEIQEVEARGKKSHLVRRHLYDTRGMVRLRPAENHAVVARTAESLGVTAFRATADGEREGSPESSHSTPFYKMLAEIVRYVAHGGPVLILNSTRAEAVRNARALADGLEPSMASRSLSEFARIRLGAEHPLVDMLLRGVAFHHAGLPVDVLGAIEEGLRSDEIRFLVSTSTLTEGVNLPVRTVVLAATPYPGQPEEQQLTGARLINAIGRAGRATRETEGWVVLARQAAPLDTDFDLLVENRDELAVSSRLASEEALESLAAWEQAISAGSDAVSAARSGPIADFASFVWFVLSAEEELGRIATSADPIGAFRATLAYTELDQGTRDRFERLVAELATEYEATDPVRRRRWARTGTSVASAQVLDELGSLLATAAEFNDGGDPASVEGALSLLDREGVFDQLLRLPERPRNWSFRKTRGGKSELVAVNVLQFLKVWVAGSAIPLIADQVFAEIPDRELRLERAVDAITDFCEHYFSWTLGVVVAMANERLQESGVDIEIAPELPIYVRYGVESQSAVGLLLAGVRSRELATQVALAAIREDHAEDIRQWVGSMTISDWREKFGATPADVLDLIEYARRRDLGLLRTLLSEGAVAVEVTPIDGSVLAGDSGASPLVVQVRPVLGGSPELGVFDWDRGALVASIPTSAHSDVQTVLDTGFVLRATLDEVALTIAIADD